METNQKKQFADNYMLTCLAYEKEFKAEVANLYFHDLSDYSIEQVSIAFSKHRKDPDRGRFFPKVADLVYQITGTEKQQGESLEQQAELQWAAIMRAATNGSEPVNISVEARSALRAIGGCQKVGYTLEKEIPFLKREFIALFKSISKASISQLDESLPCYALLVSKKTQVTVK